MHGSRGDSGRTVRVCDLGVYCSSDSGGKQCDRDALRNGCKAENSDCTLYFASYGHNLSRRTFGNGDRI